ncbi:MAG: response regulator [Nitrospira sp.]
MNTTTLKPTPSYPNGKTSPSARSKRRRKSPHTILVIEHDDRVRKTLCNWVRETGFEAVGEKNGRSALSRMLLREHTVSSIDGVLMDMNLGLCESELVLSKLRDIHPPIPVVMIGPERQASHEEAVRMGALGYLRSPFNRDVFKNKCSAFFRDPDEPD